jgi:hypothetical protein
MKRRDWDVCNAQGELKYPRDKVGQLCLHTQDLRCGQSTAIVDSHHRLNNASQRRRRSADYV